MIIDMFKYNGLSWDVVFFCEGLGKYKFLFELYLVVVEYLQLKFEECCMVVCYYYDLDVVCVVGFRIVYFYCFEEWGICQIEILSEILSVYDIVV